MGGFLNHEIPMEIAVVRALLERLSEFCGGHSRASQGSCMVFRMNTQCVAPQSTDRSWFKAGFKSTLPRLPTD